MRHIRAQAPAVQNGLTRTLGISTAGVIVLLLVAQLFSFEKLPFIFSEVLRVDIYRGSVIAALVTAAELLSLPFLLGMAVSLLMRYVSAIAGYTTLFFWLFIGLVTQFSDVTVMNIGLLGTSFPIVGGWWLVSAMAAFLITISWYSVRTRLK